MDAPEEGTPPGRTRRRPAIVIVAVVVGVLLVGVVGVGVWSIATEQPDFAYEGPPEAVAPGATVTVHAPDDRCGPLVVSLHREGRLGLWSQTHSGDIFSGFAPDARPWWSLGGTYVTPVPCGMDGTTTFALPEDVGEGTVAACDTDGRCARIHVER